MGKGKWTRWGRGSCEGYGLEIGNALRASISRDSQGAWRTSINAVSHGDFATIEQAKKRIEETIRDDVNLIFEDWELWNNPPGKTMAMRREARSRQLIARIS